MKMINGKVKKEYKIILFIFFLKRHITCKKILMQRDDFQKENERLKKVLESKKKFENYNQGFSNFQNLEIDRLERKETIYLRR